MNPYVQALLEAVTPALAGDQPAAAIPILKLALQSGASDAYPYYLLGNCQFRAGQHEAAATALTIATKLDASRAEVFNDLAAALFVLGQEAQALVCLQRSLALQPDLAEAQETDAIWLLRYGRFREGWRRYEARLRTAANRHMWSSFAEPAWHGEPLRGRTILLHAEQGLGDALQFVRYAPLVAARGGRVLLRMYPEVSPLMQALPGVSQVIDRGNLPPFDLHCPLMSLPMIFGTELDSIPATVPYLTVPPDRLALWRQRLGPARGVRVGIAWAGNPKHRDDARRSIPLALFQRILAAYPDVEFHVCQSPIRPEDAAHLAEIPNVRNHAALLRDFGDTGAVLSCMDILISVDTSVVHAAGALGRPACVLLAAQADWRWLLDRHDSPWYPSLRLVRQRQRGDWSNVLAEAIEWLDQARVQYAAGAQDQS